MEWDIFVSRRALIAHQIYWELERKHPKDSIEIHEPDGIGAVGIKYPDGYILIQVEDAS